MVNEIILSIVSAASTLLAELGGVFEGVLELLFDFSAETITDLGTILLATAGFALAYAGIRFVFGLVSRLTGAVRGGGR
jgi:hypothetical protein